MIVVDTNVISEAMRATMNPTVEAWLNDQVAETLYLTSVTLAELMYGVGNIPDGRRKGALNDMLEGVLELFGDRVLSFDPDAARTYAQLAVKAKCAGKRFPTPDGYIAAIAIANGYAVATRDTAPFEAAGVPVINPWQA
jgi:predicted nucleic acid-binding protein